MFAQINHMAFISHQYLLLGKFYEALFGLKVTGQSKPQDAVGSSDGYVGIQFIPRRDGYVGGLDHFGMMVDDLEQVGERLRKYPSANMVKRPSTRPFAAYTANDPDGNHFDLSQKDSDSRKDIYALDQWDQERYASLFALRTLNPERVAEFYADVFELTMLNKDPNDPHFRLTDGRVTLKIMPWNIADFEGMSIKRPGADHIGFKVEDIEAFKTDVAMLAGANTYLAPVQLGGSPEAEVRRRYFERSAGGKFQLTDPDGGWIDVTDEE